MFTRSVIRPAAVAGAFVLALAAGFTPAAFAQGKGASLPDFTDLYDKAGPTVVSIDVTQKSRRTRGMPELSEDDPFDNQRLKPLQNALNDCELNLLRGI